MLPMFGGVVAATVFATWFLVSILGQVNVVDPRSRFQRMRRYDVFGLIPVWTFFAPRPAWTDYHLLYRDLLDTGEVTAWSEVVTVPKRRSLHAVWNPDKHTRKAVIDLIRTFTKELEHVARGAGIPDGTLPTAAQLPARILTSMSYLSLLSAASAQPHFGNPRATQLLVMKRDPTPGARPRAMLVSPFHQL